MSQIIDAVTAPAKKSLLPWLIAAFLVAILCAGGTGMYFGYQISEGQNATERLELVAGFNTALTEKEARRQEAEAKSRLVEGTFLTALKGVQGANASSWQRVLEETRKTIYDTCKVPDTGVDMINNHIDEVNSRLSKGKK